jgi:ATP-dependent DNA helicase RecQ
LNIDKKVDLPDIAKQLGIEFNDLIGEMEQIVNTGTKLNIKYFLGQFLDDDLQDEIIQYFRSIETEDVDAAVEYFDGEFSFEELKLMHLQFVSDLAN